MKSKQITVNGISITVHSDGSISKPDNRLKDKGTVRTFGTSSDYGYMKITLGSRTFRVHRLIAQAFLPDFHDFPEVHHNDGDGLNNDISNLRMSTHQESIKDKQRKGEDCTSQYRGVCWHRGRKAWVAHCKVDGKSHHLGIFDDEHDAAIARDDFAFANGFTLASLNYPDRFKGLTEAA